MVVVLCGVGGDSTNVRPVPEVAADGRFEYVPIPEKCETTEALTYGTIPRRHDDGVLADDLRWVKPRSESADPADPRNHPVHRDPNFEHLTYGEHRPAYVSRLRSLDSGDAVGFYTGLRPDDGGSLHRYLVGYFAVADVVVLDPSLSAAEKRDRLAAHRENAHAKRFAARGELYRHDSAAVRRVGDVVVVDGERPGGLLDRAIRLTDRREGPNYYMAASVRETLRAENDWTGGIKPAIRCDTSLDRFERFVSGRTAGPSA